MLAVLLLTPFNNGGVSMTKKALSTLSLFAGATSWKNSATKAPLALSDLRWLLRLEEHAQQAPASTHLVRALGCRGLHAEATCRSERSQYFYPQANIEHWLQRPPPNRIELSTYRYLLFDGTFIDQRKGVFAVMDTERYRCVLSKLRASLPG
jgi:hypothetical protein